MALSLAEELLVTEGERFLFGSAAAAGLPMVTQAALTEFNGLRRRKRRGEGRRDMRWDGLGGWEGDLGVYYQDVLYMCDLNWQK